MSQATVLVVDDEKAHRLMLRAHLGDAGYRVLEAAQGEEALAHAGREPVDLVLLDIVMPRMGGMETLARLKELMPEVPVIMMTAFGSIQSAVEALKQGAADYLPKPLEMEEVLIKVERHLDRARLDRKLREQAERLGERFDFSALIGESAPMRRLKETLSLVAPAEATVLIAGASGTGKEVVAQVIHQNSPRAGGPLVKVNCAALPENLLESELFGHEKGAFTGADRRREGRFQAAQGGAIFLDEVTEMSPGTQAKLLRVLQEGEFTPVGSDRVLRADARVIAATNRDLAQAVAEGDFREDLYYRLNVLRLDLVPLNQRGEDVMLLAEKFLARLSEKNRRDLRGFSPEARAAILAYDWPGNVRELMNAVERAVVLAQGHLVEAGDLPDAVGQPRAEGGAMLKPGMTVREAERRLIEITLESNGGNRTHAAEMLGITRKTLQNKIKEYGLPPAG